MSSVSPGSERLVVKELGYPDLKDRISPSQTGWALFILIIFNVLSSNFKNSIKFTVKPSILLSMKTCVSIRQKRQEEALKSLQKVKGKVHLAEIWLDQIQDLDLNSLLKKAPLPLLITYKRPVDGGAFQGDWKAMAGGLLEAIKFGVDYVDIPLEMPKELNKKIVQSSPKSNTKIIASYHDFSSTPGLLPLQKLAQELADRGGDILKIATQVTCDEDVLNLMSLALDFKKEGIEHIIIGMGEKGRVTRVMAEELGNVINFVALSQKEARWGQGWVEEF